MENYNNLIEAIEGLRRQGYTVDFNIRQDCLECNEPFYKLMPDEFTIDKYFRFDTMTDPGDESIIYAVSSEKYNIKGIIINGYSIDSDAEANNLLKKLKINRN